MLITRPSCFTLLVLVLASTNWSASLQQDPLTPNELPAPGNKYPGSGLMNIILQPVRATIKQARSLFTNPTNNEFSDRPESSSLFRDGIDSIKQRAFNMYMRLYNKTYSREEIPRRLALYVKRMNFIEQSNKLFREGKLSFSMKPNKFLDWDESELNMLSRTSLPSELDPDEIDQEQSESGENEQTLEANVIDGANSSDIKIRMKRSNGQFDDNDTNFSVRAESVPSTFSWVDSGCVARPIDQGTCGSCYAVSTMSAIESTRCIKQGSGAILSSQEIVDCGAPKSAYNIHGCDGGWPTSVFKYLQDTGRAVREQCYPYTLARSIRHKSCSAQRALQSSADCRVNPSLRTSSPIQYKVLRNENDILYHVAKTGPVVTVIQTTNKLLYYGQGIMEDSRCSGSRDAVDHAITIVGYGRENNRDYWLIKNSWGTDWGNGGYAKIRRGQYTCSIGRWGWVMTG